MTHVCPALMRRLLAAGDGGDTEGPGFERCNLQPRNVRQTKVIPLSRLGKQDLILKQSQGGEASLLARIIRCNEIQKASSRKGIMPTSRICPSQHWLMGDPSADL